MRLIDADALKAKQKEMTSHFICVCGEPIKPIYTHAVSVEEIDHAPTVEERKHGHIEYNERTGTFECSVCKACWYLITPPKHKYCPECGAKMDGKDDGDGIS